MNKNLAIENKELRAELDLKDELLRDLIEDVIEENPDEGPYCFFCWGKVDTNRVIDHSSNCIVIRTEQALQNKDNS